MVQRLFLAAFILGAACAQAPRKTAVFVIDRWSAPSRTAARFFMEKYGLPDDVTPERMVWNRKGHWKRTVVWNHREAYRRPRDFDVVEQTIAYPATREQAAEIVAFSDAILVDVDQREISTRGPREAVNFLNVNLADEVARGGRKPEDAKVFYKRILDLTAAGKDSPYADRLLFDGEN